MKTTPNIEVAAILSDETSLEIHIAKKLVLAKIRGNA